MSERQLERETELYEDLQSKTIEQIRASVPRGRIGPAHCIQCGNEIPDARRLGGYDRCISCAEFNEALDRRYGAMP